MTMILTPINTDEEGNCRCIKAGYYKMGWTNFTREMLGARDGFTATAILEREKASTGYQKLDDMMPKVIRGGWSGKAWVDCFMGRCVYTEVAPALRTRSIVDCNDWIVEEDE